MENKITSEELNLISEHQEKTRRVILELGEIELIKLQLEKRYLSAKQELDTLETSERNITKTFVEKYGKISIDNETGEFTKLD